MRLLVEAFVALSLAFGTLALPLAFDGRLTSAAWALERAAGAWIAVRQGRLPARWVRWRSAGWVRLALYPAVVMQLALEILRGTHPFAELGLAAWVIAFSAHFWLLERHRADHRPLTEGLHAAGVWVAAIIGARELAWWIDFAVEGKRVWPSIAWAIVPAAMLAALSASRVQARWPIAGHVRSYVVAGGVPLAVFLALWVFY